MTALGLSKLGKRFGATWAVRELDLEVPEGELFALLGANGAGKTTTLRMIAGLLLPTEGDVSILGHSVTREPNAAKRPLAYLPDDPLLYGKLRPLEYLEFVAGLWGLSATSAARRAQELLTWLGLWEHRFEVVETYSRGMKQKLALAGALIHEPRVMLLDEPLTGLDAAAAKLVKDALRDFVASGGTIVLTTHILDVAERMADRIGIIAGGRLIAQGTLADLRAQSGEEGGTLEAVFLDLVARGSGRP
ncbi:ABC transporter ATP-binding protein [Deinococcus yavapaiensis]|uniref:ABC-2 type transport system ATP-binding protein n=1 Tax=Deinococcus yavapaiensis KR-236 TaxID=694435 RepID=A0A318S9H5_9DEIO|nr:ABC transporter ATP-binding protein [Deinococcus yavapaiensis]PYE55790.1 ABC-2 type transport system ATP-binding protein [Deinococcus yavapaiensis KR-236]